MKFKRMIIMALMVAPILAACTPQQIAWFKDEATPEQQQVVIKAIQQQNKPKAVNSGNCFAAARKYFPQGQWNKAYSIIKRESGGNATAKNSRSSASGCFQIVRGSWQNPNVSWSAGRFNADANAHAAYIMWRDNGWGCTCTWALTA